ncbi:MAG: SDR family oxidoreductase [Hyphomonadaceae bacterium]|nr:SDR family oxidoreductase [Hyphomonadaceae bacterium]
MTVALVTGGGGGIGRSIALRLAEDAYDIAVADIDAPTGAETVREVNACGRRAMFIPVDVSNSAELAACVDAVEAHLGAIAAFANNAGIEGVVAPIHDYPDDVFDQVMAVNARGVFLGLKHVLGRMHKRGKGAVVNTASSSSIRGRSGLAAYVASKHAVLGLTRVAALDMAGTAVRVNAVLAGPINTRMIHALDAQARDVPGAIRRATSEVAYGKPRDVANVVAFLLSEQAAHVNGAAWVVDAGVTVA